MVTPLLSAPVGLVLGFLAGLGVGGGSLLILYLTLLAGMDAATARATNLLFFLAAAGSVSILRLRNGSLSIKKLLPAIISACIAAGIASWVGTQLDEEILQKFFGILLLATGLRELFYRPRKAK